MTAGGENRVAVGRRLRRLRQAQGLTAQELAKRASISAGFLSEVERGLTAISTEKMMDICRALGVSASDVLEDRPQPTPSGGAITVPTALSEVADRLDLPHWVVVHLLNAQRSLTARRSQNQEEIWGSDEWLKFYNQVREFIDEVEGSTDATSDRSGRASSR